MASLDSLKTKALLAKGVVIQNYGADTPVVMKLRYVGTGTVTSVTVTTATNIVTVSTEGSKTYTFASYTTIGAVVDAINADGIFEAKILDALRSAASASRLLDGAISSTTDEDGKTVWNVKLDTSTGLQYAACLSPLRLFDAPKGHNVKLQEIKYAINMGTAAVDSVQIYKRNGTVESKIYSGLSVDTTATTINWASGIGFISGNDNEEIIVIVKDAATLADDSGNYLQVSGLIS
jgi:hypothetical protein